MLKLYCGILFVQILVHASPLQWEASVVAAGLFVNVYEWQLARCQHWDHVVPFAEHPWRLLPGLLSGHPWKWLTVELRGALCVECSAVPRV